MAVWLAEQVGPTGQVVATDVDTRYLSRLELANLEVVEHNILDDPLDVLGPGSFDLVCSRLMLFHLKGRQEQAIGQMAACLRPGGWLLDEDADWGTAGPVDPAHPLHDDYQRVWRDGDWWVPRGYDKSVWAKAAGPVRALRAPGHTQRGVHRGSARRLPLGEMVDPDPAGHQRARRWRRGVPA